MTTDEDALLAAIAAAPDDDAPRLVYADWLQERGADAKAEYLRTVAKLMHAPNDTALVERCTAIAERLEPQWRQRVGARFEVLVEGKTPWLLIAHLFRAVANLAHQQPFDLWQFGRPVKIQRGLTREDAEQFVRTFGPNVVAQGAEDVPLLRLFVQVMDGEGTTRPATLSPGPDT